jgi:hypothetical protein
LPLLAGAGLGPRLARLLAAGGGGVAAYGLGLWLLRLPEAAAAMRLLTARLGWRGTA